MKSGIQTPDRNPFENFFYRVHIDSIRVGPRVLKIFFKSKFERSRNLIELNEFSDSKQLRVIPSGAAVESLNDGTDVSKYGSVHQSCEFCVKLHLNEFY